MMTDSTSQRCASCDERLLGRFCHVCGERRVEPRDLTVAAFGRYAMAALTNADAKLYKTIRLLVGAPGTLTRAFMSGRRQPYVGPLQLFLLANLVYFVLLQAVGGTQAFTTDLVYHRTQPVYGPVAQQMLTDRIGELPERDPEHTVWQWAGTWSEDQRAFRRRFNERSPRYANSLVLLMVPLFAGATRLLRRRGLFVRELVFSLHFFAAVLLLLALLPLPFMLLYLLRPDVGAAVMGASEAVVGIPLGVLMAIYLAIAFRNAHGDPWAAAVARSIVALLLLFLVVTAYRGVLFFVVFWGTW